MDGVGDRRMMEAGDEVTNPKLPGRLVGEPQPAAAVDAVRVALVAVMDTWRAAAGPEAAYRSGDVGHIETADEVRCVAEPVHVDVARGEQQPGRLQGHPIQPVTKAEAATLKRRPVNVATVMYLIAAPPAPDWIPVQFARNSTRTSLLSASRAAVRYPEVRWEAEAFKRVRCHPAACEPLIMGRMPSGKASAAV